MKWVWIILALVYLLSPYDIIPGVSAISWLDDIFVLVLLYRYLSRFKRTPNPGGPPFDEHRQTNGPQSARSRETQPRPKSPYEILGVSATANPEEIKTAYRRLVNQYHPDKVSHLGEEFQALAEVRFKEIQQAYQQLIP